MSVFDLQFSGCLETKGEKCAHIRSTINQDILRTIIDERMKIFVKINQLGKQYIFMDSTKYVLSIVNII